MPNLTRYLGFVTMMLFIVFFQQCNHKKEEVLLSTFFKVIDWQDFNARNLKKNNLSHFLSDSVDYYHRATFFKYMRDVPNNTPYQEFYLIEIYSSGEVVSHKNILVVKHNNEILYFSYKGVRTWKEFIISSRDKSFFNYEKLQKGTFKPMTQDTLITKVTGLSY